jgi:large subunit ribosomal protein L3
MADKELETPHKLMGKKCGMMQYFDETGAVTPCTVISMEPNVITQLKTKENDGYTALQMGYDEVRTKDARTIEKRVTKPLRGHFAKAKVPPCRHLVEVRASDISGFEVGQKLEVTLFKDVTYVDVLGVSKGKGFQGVIKLHNFKGGPAQHGSGFHRHAGSTGMRTSPGRCLPGGPRPSHMGCRNVTTANIQVVAIDEANSLLFLKGAVPGPRGGIVVVEVAKKKQKKQKKQ